MKGHIRKRSVDLLVCPPGRDRIIMWDDKVTGFGVAAFPSGTKVYVAGYRRRGKWHIVRIGRHGPLTPEQARKLAMKLLAAVADGKDPAGERRSARDAPTFESIAEEYEERHLRAKGRSPRTIAEFARVLNRNINPVIGKKRLNEIALHVRELHHSLRGTPSHRRRGRADMERDQ